MNRPCRTASVVLALILMSSSAVMAAGGGGGGEADDGGGDTMTYITIGLAAVVGGLLLLDVLSSSEEAEGSVSEDELMVQEQTSTDTGVDWSAAFPDQSEAAVLGVAVFESQDRVSSAARLMEAVSTAAPNGFPVFGDPLDLGPVSPEQGAIMASEYFGIDYLIFLSDAADDSVTIGVASPDSVLWTSRCIDSISFAVPVAQIMEAGILGNR